MPESMRRNKAQIPIAKQDFRKRQHKFTKLHEECMSAAKAIIEARSQGVVDGDAVLDHDEHPELNS